MLVLRIQRLVTAQMYQERSRVGQRPLIEAPQALRYSLPRLCPPIRHIKTTIIITPAASIRLPEISLTQKQALKLLNIKLWYMSGPSYVSRFPQSVPPGNRPFFKRPCSLWRMSCLPGTDKGGKFSYVVWNMWTSLN